MRVIRWSVAAAEGSPRERQQVWAAQIAERRSSVRVAPPLAATTTSMVREVKPCVPLLVRPTRPQEELKDASRCQPFPRELITVVYVVLA